MRAIEKRQGQTRGISGNALLRPECLGYDSTEPLICLFQHSLDRAHCGRCPASPHRGGRRTSRVCCSSGEKGQSRGQMVSHSFLYERNAELTEWATIRRAVGVMKTRMGGGGDNCLMPRAVAVHETC